MSELKEMVLATVSEILEGEGDLSIDLDNHLDYDEEKQAFTSSGKTIEISRKFKEPKVA